MTPIAKMFLTLAVLSAGFQVQASDPIPSRNDPVQEIYQRTGLEQQFEYMAASFSDAGMMASEGMSEGGLDEVVMSRLTAVLSERFSVQRLQDTVKSNLRTDLDNAAQDRALDILSSSVWSQAVKLESLVQGYEQQSDMENYILNRLQQFPPRPLRVSLISELVDRAEMVDITMDVMVEGALAASRILMQDLAENSSVPEEQFAAIMRERMDPLRSEYRNLLIQQMLYTYRSMPDEQLQQYVSYYRQPVIQSMNASIRRSLQQVIR